MLPTVGLCQSPLPVHQSGHDALLWMNSPQALLHWNYQPSRVETSSEMLFGEIVERPEVSPPDPGWIADPVATGVEIQDQLWPIPPLDWTTWRDPQFWIDYWTPQRFEMGGNFQEGRRQAWNLNTRFQWNHNSERLKHEFDLRGRFAQQEVRRSANEWIFRGNWDYKSTRTPWLVFQQASVEYDELERLSVRATTSGGAGYRFFDESPKRYLVVRFGPTITYENYYAPDRVEWKPEFLAETQAKYVIWRMTLEHKSSVFPSFDEGEGVRIQNDSGLLIPLDRDNSWSTKLGFTHNYNGTPNRSIVRNDYTASFSLVYKR